MKFKTAPFPHQLEAFNKCVELPYFALLAEMGTGKTKITIDVAAHHYLEQKIDRLLVVAPNSVHPQWLNEQFPVHCPIPYRGFVYQGDNNTVAYLRKLDTFMMTIGEREELCVLTMNIEAFAYKKGIDTAKQFLNTAKVGTMIVVDEASRIKNPSAKTVKTLCKIRDEYPNSIRAVLTGTPAAKSVLDLWSIYDFLKKRYMGCAYAAFKAEHVVVVKKKIEVKGRLITIDSDLDPVTYNKVRTFIANNHTGKLEDVDRTLVIEAKHKFGLTEQDFWFILGTERFQRFKNIEAIRKRIEPVTFRARKQDCLELPEKIYEQHTFKLSQEQERIIKDLVSYAAATYEGEALTLNIKALLGLRVLQICGGFFSHLTDIEGEYEVMPIKGKNSKIEYLKHDIPEIGEQQFIVWAVFTPEINMLTNELNRVVPVGRLDGQVSRSAAADTIEAFKAGHLQGLISHPEVGGYGLNLQMARIQYWYSRNYRNEARLQAEDRSHRSGIVHSPVYKDLVYDQPFERKVLAANKEGADLNEMVMEVDSVRKLLTM